MTYAERVRNRINFAGEIEIRIIAEVLNLKIIYRDFQYKIEPATVTGTGIGSDSCITGVSNEERAL